MPAIRPMKDNITSAAIIYRSRCWLYQVDYFRSVRHHSRPVGCGVVSVVIIIVEEFLHRLVMLLHCFVACLVILLLRFHLLLVALLHLLIVFLAVPRIAVVAIVTVEEFRWWSLMTPAGIEMHTCTFGGKLQSQVLCCCADGPECQDNYQCDQYLFHSVCFFDSRWRVLLLYL